MDIVWRVVIVIVVTVIVNVSIFLSPRRRHELSNETSIELRYPLGFLIISIIGIALASMMVLVAINKDSLREALPPTIVSIPFLLLGLYILLELRKKIVLRPDGFYSHTPWKHDSFVPWSSIRVVRYSAVNDWFILDIGNSMHRISTHFVYFPAFLDGLMKNVEPSIWKAAIEKYARPKVAV